MRRRQLIIDDTGSAEGIYAFIYWTKWRSGQVLPMSDSLTHRQTLKDRATQLLIKYKSGALLTQKVAIYALLVCTFFGPKIYLCIFFNKFHLRLRNQNQMLKSLLPTLSICGNVFGGRSHLLHH